MARVSRDWRVGAVILALLFLAGCAHPRPLPRSCLFPEFNPCPTGSLCRYVQSDTHPDLLNGSYICRPVVPTKAPESK